MWLVAASHKQAPAATILQRPPCRVPNSHRRSPTDRGPTSQFESPNCSSSSRARFSRHGVPQKARGGTASSLHWTLGGGNELHSCNSLSSKNIRQAIADEMRTRQRPHHEEIASVPLRGIDETARLGNGVDFVLAPGTPILQSRTRSRRGDAAPTDDHELKQLGRLTLVLSAVQDLDRPHLESGHAVLVEDVQHSLRYQYLRSPYPNEVPLHDGRGPADTEHSDSLARAGMTLVHRAGDALEILVLCYDSLSIEGPSQQPEP